MPMLGDKVRDRITGYEGVLTKIQHVLDEETRGAVERADSNGVPEEYWFSLARLEYIQ